MQKTTLSQASRIFSALAAGLVLLLLAGCNLSITNLTPDTVPQNPSQIYTITASFRPSGQINPASISPRIVIDGQAHAMKHSTLNADIWEFDFQLPPGRTSASYYFICTYTAKNSTQPSEAYSELQRLNVSGRYVLKPEANRAPVGARVSVLGAGFTTSDLVYFDENPTRTVFESPSSLSFFVPSVPSGNTYRITVRGAGGSLDAGTFRVDAVYLQVYPSALYLRTEETQEVTFTIAQPAPAGGMLIDVTTDIKESIIMPEVVVPEGATSVSIPVKGAKPGTGSLFYHSSAGEGSVTVSVSAN